MAVAPGLISHNSARASESLPQIRQRGQKPANRRPGRQPQRGRTDVIGTLAQIDMLIRVQMRVFAFRAPHQLQRAIGDDLIRIHIGRCTGTALDLIVLFADPRPEIANFSRARRVWMPQQAAPGTSRGPSRSRSMRTVIVAPASGSNPGRRPARGNVTAQPGSGRNRPLGRDMAGKPVGIMPDPPDEGGAAHRQPGQTEEVKPRHRRDAA